MSLLRRGPGSLRARLILHLLAGAALLALLLFFALRSYARDLAASSQDQILAASVTAILDAVAVRGGEVVADIPYSAFSMLGNVSDDRVFYLITRDGTALTGYADLPAPGPASGADDLPRYHTALYDGTDIRMATAARRLSIAGAPTQVQVTVAQTRDGLRQVLRGIGWTAAGFGLGFFVLAAGLGVLAARSATGPLDQLAGAMSRRGPEDLRPVAAPAFREMMPLVSALNGFMRRLTSALDRSEELIAEAAHRVRTPLATVRTQAEITLRRVEKPENRHAVREMIRAIDESSRAAGQILDHAMVSFRTENLARAEVDLARLVQDATARLQPMADLRDIEIAVSIPPTPLATWGDAIVLQSAVMNLLDNAIKYAPRDSTVDITCTATDDGACVSVCDGGAGFPADQITELQTRFVRGANTAGVVGSGLGLTIADEVARAHGGRLALRNRTERSGACASLHLPRS